MFLFLKNFPPGSVSTALPVPFTFLSEWCYTFGLDSVLSSKKQQGWNHWILLLSIDLPAELRTFWTRSSRAQHLSGVQVGLRWHRSRRIRITTVQECLNPTFKHQLCGHWSLYKLGIHLPIRLKAGYRITGYIIWLWQNSWEKMYAHTMHQFIFVL